MLKSKITLVVFSAASLLGLSKGFSQPTPAPTSGDLLCSTDTSAATRQDTVVSQPDSDGFISIFDGRTFKGWWQDCMSVHSAPDRVNGGVFRVDTALHAIFSASRNNNTTGGILLTHKRYRHYEILFDHWGGWGNDGGFFNRTTLSGGAWQTMLDYLAGRSFGGSYGEAYVVDFALVPFGLGNDDSTVTVPGFPYTAGNGQVWPALDWTTETAALAARGQSTGCVSSGCTPADWRNNWKPSSSADGWNTLRVQFYGGLSQNQSMNGDKIHMHAFFRNKHDVVHTRLNDIDWISIGFDSMALTNAQVAGAPMNPIGFEVHGAGRFPNLAGTWYRNIKIRELDSLGRPLSLPVPVVSPNGNIHYGMYFISDALVGSINQNHQIMVRDAKGRVLEMFYGPPGYVHYQLGANARGLLFVEIKTSQGIECLRLIRLLQ